MHRIYSLVPKTNLKFNIVTFYLVQMIKINVYNLAEIIKILKNK